MERHVEIQKSQWMYYWGDISKAKLIIWCWLPLHIIAGSIFLYKMSGLFILNLILFLLQMVHWFNHSLIYRCGHGKNTWMWAWIGILIFYVVFYSYFSWSTWNIQKYEKPVHDQFCIRNTTRLAIFSELFCLPDNLIQNLLI